MTSPSEILDSARRRGLIRAERADVFARRCAAGGCLTLMLLLVAGALALVVLAWRRALGG